MRARGAAADSRARVASDPQVPTNQVVLSGASASGRGRLHHTKQTGEHVAPLGNLEGDVRCGEVLLDVERVELSAPVFTIWQKDYASKEEAYRCLGVGQRLRGHCARCAKCNGKTIFLKCNLGHSSPPCSWTRLLRVNRGGDVSMYMHPHHGQSHNPASKLVGKRGLEDITERRELETLMQEPATSSPRVALRIARKSGKVVCASKTQAQKLKKGLMRGLYRSKVLGDLHKIVLPNTRLPDLQHDGYFCFHEITRLHNAPRFAVVATTRALQERWGSGRALPAHADGGYKFNVCGWPVTVFGQTNHAGQWSLGALMLSSTLDTPHLTTMFRAFRSSTERVSRQTATRDSAMCDAQDSFREALRSALDCKCVLMCYFHVKAAARKWLFRHCRGDEAFKEALWSGVSADLDIMRAARTLADFRSRSTAMDTEWKRRNIDRDTRWVDANGAVHNWCLHFHSQWVAGKMEWFVGAASLTDPSTNNAAEITVRIRGRISAGVLVMLVNVCASSWTKSSRRLRRSGTPVRKGSRQRPSG